MVLLGGLFEFAGGFLEGGEFRIFAQPLLPLGGERFADALAAQNCMQMATRYTQLTAGDEAARVFRVAALVGCGFHVVRRIGFWLDRGNEKVQSVDDVEEAVGASNARASRSQPLAHFCSSDDGRMGEGSEVDGSVVGR